MTLLGSYNATSQPASGRVLRRLARTLTCVVLLGACAQQGGTEPEALALFDGVDADQVIIGLDQWLTREGVRRAQIQGDTAYVFTDSSRVQLRGVNVLMYDEGGRQNANLTSLSGVLDTRTEAMVARGEVVLTTAAGNRRIMTEELHYDPQSGRIWSEVETTMVEDGSRITGTGFTSDTEFRNVQVTNPRGQTQNLRIEF
ncbi:MAG: LPS export ABC transporter periplasmic protein LptC [Longimicrobiales bacterium]